MDNKQISESSQPVAPAEDEAAIDVRTVMSMRRQTYRWSCPGCPHRFRFKIDQIEAVPFFIIRHLIREHGIQPSRIAAVEPCLADEARAYCRLMHEGW